MATSNTDEFLRNMWAGGNFMLGLGHLQNQDKALKLQQEIAAQEYGIGGLGGQQTQVPPSQLTGLGTPLDNQGNQIPTQLTGLETPLDNQGNQIPMADQLTGQPATTVGLKQQALSIQQQHIDIAKQEAAMRQKEIEMKVAANINNATVPSTFINGTYSEISANYGKGVADAFKPLAEDMTRIQRDNPQITMEGLYQSAIRSYQIQGRDSILDNLDKYMQGDDYAGLSAPQKEKIAGLKQALLNDPTGDTVLGQGPFMMTKQAMDRRDESTRAAIAQMRATQGDVVQKPDGSWAVIDRASGESTDLGGTPLQAVTSFNAAKEATARAYLRDNFRDNRATQKDENAALTQDYKDIDKAYRDIIKGDKPDPDWSDAYFKQVQDAARRGLSYLPSIRGNREKLNQAMSWFSDIYTGNSVTPQTQTANLPKGAQTGTYNGVRAYTTDGKIFYDMSGKRLN